MFQLLKMFDLGGVQYTLRIKVLSKFLKVPVLDDQVIHSYK